MISYVRQEHQSQLFFRPLLVIDTFYVPGTLVTNLMTVEANTFVFALCGIMLVPLRSTMLTAPTVFNPYTKKLLPE
jgi:hypothetical protein